MSTSEARSLVARLSESIRNNREVAAISDLNSTPLTYAELAEEIARIHQIFINSGVLPGDKVAICGRNSAHWALTFISCLTYGAVSVPILNDFKPDSIQHLIDHSDAKIAFTDDAVWKNLDIATMPQVEGFFDIETGRLRKSLSEKLTSAYENIEQLMKEAYPGGVTAENFDKTYYKDSFDDLALINYTSGSTGMSKGVMLPYGSLWSNSLFATDNISFYVPGDTMVSILPLAHMFGMLVELIFPMIKGCHIIFLGRVPSPKIVLDAFSKYKPKMVVTVPLVIEKIVFNKIFPILDKPLMKFITKVPGLNKVVYNKICKQMIDGFGGNIIQMIIGGAALNKAVEEFLLKIKFPYTVGYGMTECGPLIAYCRWDLQKQGSCGKIVDRMEARIDSDDPVNKAGVLWVRGDNVMKGYYKNPEADEGVFNGEWMNTGDICTLDNDGYLFIRGRDKSMILGPSGQNIYPEEIENKLNRLQFVAESVVVEREGKIVALVYPDFEAARQAKVEREKLDEIMDLNLSVLNRDIPAYSRVARIELRNEPFEKTPKQSIKRYLYK